jgi:FkbM family methyltransferase
MSSSTASTTLAPLVPEHSAQAVSAPTSTAVLARCLLSLLPLRHGKHRLVDRTALKRLPIADGLVRCAYAGRVLHIDPNDLVGRHFFLVGSFDPEVIDVLLAAAAGPEVLWDVGANAGTCSYAMAARLPTARVVAFEPQRRLARLVHRNLCQFRGLGFEVFDVALSTSAGTARLHVPEGNSGKASLHGDAAAPGQEVQIATAEDARRASRFGWPTLVKIDVEGHELEVLRTLRPAFAEQKIKAVVFEHHRNASRSLMETAAPALEAGLDLFAIRKSAFRTDLHPVTSDVPGSVTDFVALRPETVDRVLKNLRIGKNKDDDAIHRTAPEGRVPHRS